MLDYCNDMNLSEITQYHFTELDLTVSDDDLATTKATTMVPKHSEARKFLECLTNDCLITLGVYLGLRYVHLKKMKEDCLLDEMLDSWLREDDDVIETSGHPSWPGLVQALENAGYNGVAAEIRKGMCRIQRDV